MLELNPRRVDFVRLVEGGAKGTQDITVIGRNDQNKGYEITLRGIGGLGSPVQERAVISHLQNLHEMGQDAHISYKYPVLLSICNFVCSFFEPHDEEEE